MKKRITLFIEAEVIEAVKEKSGNPRKMSELTELLYLYYLTSKEFSDGN